MRIENEWTPRLPARPPRPAETPAVAPEPADSVAFQLIIPSAADLQIEADPALWISPGLKQSTTAQGIRVIDLGQGCVRRELPDGRVTLDGTKRLGTPVHRVRRPDGETSWQVDYPEVMRASRADLEGVDRNGPTSVEPLAHGRALRYPSGPAGTHYTRLEVPDRPTLPIISDGPLGADVLDHMAAAVAGAPRRAFADVKLMYVLGELGATEDGRGRPLGTVAGFAQYQSQTLFFARDRLQRAADAQETMWHEAGHLFDRAHQASDTLKAADGVPVFGYGKLIMEGARVAVDESDFITKYAATNEQEDFAENHRAALELRASWNEAHPGSEFLELRGAELDAQLAPFSDGIKRRMGSIVRIYQEEQAGEPPRP